MSVKSIDVLGRKVESSIDYSEPTQDEIDRILYDDVHIRVIVDVSSDNDIKVNTHVDINVNGNYR